MADDTRQDQSEVQAESASAARLFDVRRIIGGLFVVYGVLLTVAGLVDGDGAKKKAQGVDINLWSGIAMLVVGALFLLWMRLSPNKAPDPDEVDTDRPSSH
ncbi:hypothetical protein EV189_1790 [Motilibacter rhizosphaerae]|uniref:Uncharacterized protein n=1 Tax=Motilibacter rhizosphaerae TaxID=598652 RepID=A0A4Q7NT84_9ACTN|nr:hypothetical protein [Motilibacter rhizosphaerae]RZS90008.1 hypothetical protein EV189_1790 [Motilibacter rhizosphaerae]